MFLKLSLDKFGFQQILDDFEKTSNISILTYNISTNENRLLDILKKLEGKKIVIITNIQQRWERYEETISNSRKASKYFRRTSSSVQYP